MAAVSRYAFKGCTALTSLDLSNTTFIGENAFQDCTGLTSVTFPTNSFSLGAYAFRGCTGLTTLDVSKVVYSLQKGVFQDCSRLTTIQLPDRMSRLYGIEESAFSGCSSLTAITIPEGIEEIKTSTFSGCSSLTEVSIPNGVKRIAGNAFSGCSSLKTVHLPGSVGSIDKTAFSDCDAVTDVYYGSSKNRYDKLSNNSKSAFPNTATIHYLDVYIVTFDYDGKVGSWASGDMGRDADTDQKTGRLTLPNLPILNPAYAFRECRTFTGWYTEEKGGELITLDTLYTKDTTVYAQWEEHHTNVKEIPAVPPTCVNPGKTAGKECSFCKFVFEAPEDVSATGIHTRGSEVKTTITTPATCTEEGSKTVTYECSVCGALFEEEETIPLAAHTENPVPGKAATCTKDGLTDGIECSVCHTVLAAQQTIPATGHIPVDLPGEAPTCGEAGSTGGKKCSVCGEELEASTEIPATGAHTPGTKKAEDIQTYANCTNDGLKAVTYECSVCHQEFAKDEVIPATGHTPVDLPGRAATCTEKGLTDGSKCSVCTTVIKEQEDIPASGHSWGAEDIKGTKAPTCTEAGSKTISRTCTVCGEIETKTEEIAATGHTETVIPSVSPTCGTPGSTEGKKCSVCNEVFTEPQTIPATGMHIPGAVVSETTQTPAACFAGGVKIIRYSCAVCHQEFEETESIPAAHTKVEHMAGKPASCEEDGLTEGSRCDDCGMVLVAQKVIPKLGHDWGASDSGIETITKAPTCTEDGSKDIAGAVCARCGISGGSITVPIPAIGHKWGEETSEVTESATCTEDGVQTYTKRCTAEGCGEAKTRTEVISAAGHTYGEWVTTKKPTATETGSKERVCASCGNKQTETIPATGEGDTPKVFTITFDANGGSGGTTLTTGTDGKISTLPSKPTRSGYTFDNWYTAKTGGSQVTTSMVFEADATVYARWTKLPDEPSATQYRIYTPDYTSGGSVYVSHSSAAEGTRITIELSPRSGYEMDWLSVINLNTGREISLTRRYNDEYTFIMPASSVEVDAAFRSQHTGNGGWYVPEKPPVCNKPIKWYYDAGQIWHVTDGLVPHGTLLTRDMLISVLYNMDPSSTGEQVFWATEYNIVPDIYASGLWGVDKNISREQAAMILYCYSQHMGYNISSSANLTGYADYGQMRVIARPAMSWAQATGLITATPSNRLSPRSTITCGEANAILSRFVSTVAWP